MHPRRLKKTSDQLKHFHNIASVKNVPDLLRTNPVRRYETFKATLENLSFDLLFTENGSRNQLCTIK
jgi:hypothetical protein